jgi:hypothetical protein
MAIPNSPNFTLNDVRIELGGTNPYSLSTALSTAIDGNFDPTYKGSKDRLSNFRNYPVTISGPGSQLRYSTNSSGWTNSSGINQIAGEATATVFNDGNIGMASPLLNAKTFLFNIPLNATITGVEVVIRKRVSTANRAVDNQIRLLNNLTNIGNNKASPTQWSNIYTTTQYGGQFDLWGSGATLTPTLINSSNFGVHMQATWTNTSGSHNVFIEWMTIEVFYTTP